MKKILLLIASTAMILSSCGNDCSKNSNAESSCKDSVKSYMDIVKNRYSCRSYQETQVSKEHLETILLAGSLAPTAKNLQEHHVYVCQSPESLQKIDEKTPCRFGAPTVLVVTWDSNNVFTYPGEKYNSGAEDATIVATHMLLAAESVGVNSCWVNYFNPDEMRDALEIPENEVVLMILPIGYASSKAAPNQNHFSRKPLSETVSYK